MLSPTFPQDRLAGEPGTILIKACREHLERLPAERRGGAGALLTDADAALGIRHEVVHSLWPFTSVGEVRGWRNVPTRRRQHADQPVEWTSSHAAQLPDLLRNLIDLVARCREVELWVPPPVE